MGVPAFFFRLGYKPPFKGFFQGFWGQQGENPDNPIPDGFARIDFNVDEDMGWRINFRGQVPHGLQLYPGTKYSWQAIGPEKWISTPHEEQDPWYEQKQGQLKN
mmetsp:Transcript_82938/g.168329  ORF Transcript_82938/g.168329 Transcript_82938/m.168329 type:complete len:104 (-) Transcript_82938:64-375(-)